MDAESAKHPDEAAPCADELVPAADAFTQSFDTLKRVATGLGLAPADVQDVLQDVFVQASQRGPALPARQAIAWLVRVTVNRAMLEHRRRQRFRVVAQRMAQDHRNRQAAAPDDLVEQAEQIASVRQALQALDEPLLVVMTLRYFAGMDSTQIGQALDIPPATVRRRLHDARLILARHMIAQGFSP